MMAAAAAMAFPSSQETPTGMLTVSVTPFTKAANSSGIFSPVESQTVMAVAPASAAAARMAVRKAGSARVASSAQNSTSAQASLAFATVAATHSIILGGFL